MSKQQQVILPPPGTQVMVKAADNDIVIEFAWFNPITCTHRRQLFSIKDQWNKWMAEIHDEELKSLSEYTDQLTKQVVSECLEAECANAIKAKDIKKAGKLLAIFLQEVMRDEDENKIEGLRVYSQLWKALQEAQKDPAGSN
jgi:hypothetical protein